MKKMNLCCFKPLCLWQVVTAAVGMGSGTEKSVEDSHTGVPGSGEKEQSSGWRAVCGSRPWRSPPGAGGHAGVSRCRVGAGRLGPCAALAHKPEPPSAPQQHRVPDRPCTGPRALLGRPSG